MVANFSATLGPAKVQHQSLKVLPLRRAPLGVILVISIEIVRGIKVGEVVVDVVRTGLRGTLDNGVGDGGDVVGAGPGNERICSSILEQNIIYMQIKAAII